jgi:hypothetical protein
MLRGNCVCRKRSAIQRGMPGGVTFQFLRLVCRRKIDASRRPRVRRVRKIPKLCPANANDRASALLDAASADGRRIADHRRSWLCSPVKWPGRTRPSGR